MGSLGKVKVDDVIRIPSAVKSFFDLKEGDFLEFNPTNEALKADWIRNPPNYIIVKIVRTKGKKK
jgi:bifunctional DNA-binding transcriptional regulator/antitoxin component of YhaV-PrlF toxin-antitoxin module